MNASVDRYERELNRAKSEWRGNWVLPLGTAYGNAYARFLNTFREQDRVNALKAQLAMAALTMGIGGGLGAMFGKSAVSSIAVDQALTVVCNRNMTRSLSAMAAAESSAAAQFILGAAWGGASAYIKDATKQQIQGLIGSTGQARGVLQTDPADMVDAASRQRLAGGNRARDLIANPRSVQNGLEGYLDLVYAACLRSLSDIQDATGSEGALVQHVEEMRRAPFLRSPRSATLTETVGGALKAELEMELAMYMALVMNSDEVVQMSGSSSGGVTASGSVGRGVNITVPPGHADYPQEWSRSTVDCNMSILGLCISGDTSVERQSIRFRSLGSTVTSRIDALYRTLIGTGSNFFQNGMGTDEILRAQAVLNAVNTSYESGIASSSQIEPALVPAN